MAMQTSLVSDVHIIRDAEAAFTRIGLVLLATDLTTERDFADLFHGAGLRLHATRLHYANPVTPENLRAMAPRLTEAAALLPPDTPFAALYFACASGSVCIGDEAVAAALRAARPETPALPTVTPVSAAMEALQALGARRISILAPYTLETSRPVAEHFQGQGVEVLNLACLGLEDDRDMARVTPQTLVRAASDAMHPESEALFVSCTALRAAEVAAQMERQLGRAVVTSNQAAAWRVMRHCGLTVQDLPAAAGWGRLMRLAP